MLFIVRWVFLPSPKSCPPILNRLPFFPMVTYGNLCNLVASGGAVDGTRCPAYKACTESTRLPPAQTSLIHLYPSPPSLLHTRQLHSEHSHATTPLSCLTPVTHAGFSDQLGQLKYQLGLEGNPPLKMGMWLGGGAIYMPDV